MPLKKKSCSLGLSLNGLVIVKRRYERDQMSGRLKEGSKEEENGEKLDKMDKKRWRTDHMEEDEVRRSSPREISFRKTRNTRILRRVKPLNAKSAQHQRATGPFPLKEKGPIPRAQSTL